jgi:hypothetical protein
MSISKRMVVSRLESNPPSPLPKTIRHKFKAKPQTIDGLRFASKKEMRHYCDLQKLQDLGEIVFFLRQVPLPIPGGIKYICDFMVFWSNDEVTFEDVKGFKTDLYKVKKKLVEKHYPIEIIEI